MARAQQANRALVGAAARVKLDDSKAVKAQMSKRQDWQTDSWDFFDLVPEVKQLTWHLGNLIAKARLFVAVENPDDPDGEPVPVSDEASGLAPEIAARCEAELARLGTGAGGHSELLRLLNMNLEIAAEGYLIGQSARPEVLNPRTGDVVEEAKPERWRIKSIREVEVKDKALKNGRKSRVQVKDDPDDKAGEPLDPELDTAIRFWQQHPAYEKRPDCAMRACLDDCETLLVLKQQLRAEAKSHIPAGFLFASNDLTWATLNPATDGDDEDENMHPLLRQLVATLTASIEDPSHAASLAPMLGLIPVNQGEKIADKVMHMSLARTTSDTLDARIKARVETLARGLNAPVEKILGHQQTTFANADQIDEDTYKEHLDPRLLLIVDILTIGFLRPNLSDAPSVEPAPGDPPPPPLPPLPPEIVDSVFVWYDPAALIAQPDPAEHADEAHDRFVISDVAYRKLKGYSEDDAPEPVEILVRAALKGGQLGPEVTLALLELLGERIDVQPLPGSTAPGLRHKPIPVRSRELVASARPLRGVNAGRRLMEVDRDLRSRVLVLADRTMNRALERAGATLRAKASAQVRAAVRDVADNRFVAAAMGPTIVAATADVDELLAESIDAMGTSFLSWAASAQRQALDLASRIASGFSTAERDRLQLRQAADLEEAWSWMRETLTSLAHARLFDPTIAVAELGEIDTTLSVPAGLVRQAITRAGGMTGVSTGTGTDAWVALTDGGNRPAGGIGTGEVITGALADAGEPVDGYVWDYGPAMRTRPFEPHVDLDGTEFATFDDPALANDEGWPPFAFYMPGDHDGCLCDFIPIVGAQDNPGGEDQQPGENRVTVGE